MVSAYSVEFTARARKELWDLPKPIRRRIVRVLPLLGASPRQGANIKPLKGYTPTAIAYGWAITGCSIKSKRPTWSFWL